MEAKAYKRPTISVRQRPYIFYRSVANYFLNPAIPGGTPPNVINLRPQGNIADGNRVTHGWKIIVSLIRPYPQPSPVFIHLNGNNINLGYLSGPFTLIDTTLDPLGIDSTEYSIFNPDPTNEGYELNLFVVEQILQISPM